VNIGQPSDSGSYLAASLILFDQKPKSDLRLLLGRRHETHIFLPGKFVFPGGRSEPEDALMQASGLLAPEILRRLQAPAAGPSIAAPRSLALTAIRELFEETGILLGTRTMSSFEVPAATSWGSFAAMRIQPDLTQLHYIARALTPPGFPRRFDTHFFAADARNIAASREGYVHPDAELVELQWATLTELANLDVLPITAFIAQELAVRCAAGLSHEAAVPYFHMQDDRWIRTEV
jgi:8-oxo-dGTP pyrophosphatase MutT (NUDIX family)